MAGCFSSRGVVLLIVLLTSRTLVRLEAIDSLAFGGYAFAGNAVDIPQSFPYSWAVDHGSGDGSSVIGSRVNEFIRGHASLIPGVTLSFGLIQREQPPRVLVLALTDEGVLQETLGDLHKLVIGLGFELLTVDFSTLEVISSVPINLEAIDAQAAPFSSSDVAERVRAMVIGRDSQLFSVLGDKLRLVRVRSRNACTLQVNAVEIGAKALPFLPGSWRVQPAAYGRSVAQQFGGLLTARAGVALLPFSKDGLNSKMALRFSDASMLQFQIPAPTYAVHLDVTGFKKVLSRRTDSEALWIYGAYLGIKVIEPEFRKVFYEGTAKYPVSKIVPASQRDVDEFPVVSEALKGACIAGVDLLRNDAVMRGEVLSKCRL
jgi:hypothetical protein